MKYWKLKNECLHLYVILISVGTTLGFVLLIACCVFSYRRRFRLQHTCFKIQQSCGDQSEVANEHVIRLRDYEFDAFVSYSSDDRFWVHEVLMQTLEETYGFKLVIHYRDFLPGTNLHRAIDDHLAKSREFIVVVTANFLASEWCQLEMEEIYRISQDRNKNIAFIILGDVPPDITNPTARLLLDTYNYLQWVVREEDKTAHKDRQNLFWAKLVHHLYGGKHICGCSCLPYGPRAIGYKEVSTFTDNEEGE